MQPLFRTSSIALVLAAACAACAPAVAPADQLGTTTTTSAQLVTHDEAVAGLVDRRCQRADSCAEIGADARFSTTAACTDETATELARALPPERCPAFDAIAMDRCFVALRGEVCSQRLEAVTALSACSPEALCR